MKAFKILLSAFALTCAASIGYAVASYDAPETESSLINKAYTLHFNKKVNECREAGEISLQKCEAEAAWATKFHFKGLND